MGVKNKKREAQEAASKRDKKEKKKSSRTGLRALGGLLFAKMARGGAAELRSNAEEVNRLNVFPVPDGDTGDNMSMTIDSGVSALTENESDDISAVIEKLSRGMLIGARGNSGVILSQFFAGMAKGLKNSRNANPQILGRALAEGVEQAYSTVMTPTEGTILTVARESVAYANSRLTDGSTVSTLFSDLVGQMHRSLEHTPDLLPALKEAGVVDSGGAGLLYIMDGFNRVLNGEEISVGEPAAAAGGAIGLPTDFDENSVMQYGYCTEVLLQLMRAKGDPSQFDVDALRAYLSSIGDSIVAFVTGSIVKLHVHTRTPELVLGYCLKFGEFISVKIENMSLQHTETISNTEQASETDASQVPSEKKRYGIVAVSSGEGLDALFKEFGADEVIRGGQTHNPSAGEFVSAYERINAEYIFVFPNNSNVLLAATMSGEMYEGAKIIVVESTNMGAGYVALASLDLTNESPDEILEGASSAIANIRCGFISPAIRDADMNGVHIENGDTIGIIGKQIVLSEHDTTTASISLTAFMCEGSNMLTVITGKDAKDSDTDAIKQLVGEKYPDIELYFIEGGQDVYPFIFVAE